MVSESNQNHVDTAAADRRRAEALERLAKERARLLEGTKSAQQQQQEQEQVEQPPLKKKKAAVAPPPLKKKKIGSERKKVRGAWKKEEHRLFLLGLQKLGKGDWSGISRLYVPTRIAQQVASHAQKYFLNVNKRKRNLSDKAAVAPPPPVASSNVGGAVVLALDAKNEDNKKKEEKVLMSE